jgi:hypothetical protein
LPFCKGYFNHSMRTELVTPLRMNGIDYDERYVWG